MSKSLRTYKIVGNYKKKLAKKEWKKPISFEIHCYSYAVYRRDEDARSCEDTCRCIGGSPVQTEHSKQTESYAWFAQLLNVISFFGLFAILYLYYDTKQATLGIERQWPVMKARLAYPSSAGPAMGLANTVGAPVFGQLGGQQPDGVHMGIPVAGGSANTIGPGGVAGSNVVTGNVVQPDKMIAYEMQNMQAQDGYTGLLRTMDQEPDPTLRRTRNISCEVRRIQDSLSMKSVITTSVSIIGLCCVIRIFQWVILPCTALLQSLIISGAVQFLASNMVTCAELAEICARLDPDQREEFLTRICISSIHS